MLFPRSEIGLAAAAVFAVASAAPSEAISGRDANVVVRNIDPCTYDQPIVPIHEKYGTGILPKQVEDCIVKNLGPTFLNAFYNSYDSHDNSVNINGHKVNIDNSIIGNDNNGNAVGDHNIVGDNNTSVDGNGNAVANISGGGDNIVGTGNGNGNGNIDGSNVNTTGTDNNGNENSGNDLKNSGNLVNNSTVGESGNDLKNSANAGNYLGNDGNALDSAVGNDGNSLDSNNQSGNTLVPPPLTKRSDSQSCMTFKCLATVNAVLPCIFAATASSDHQALLKCGVPKQDICACSSCLPEGISEYVTDICSAPTLDGVTHSEDLTDHAFAESSDNNVRAFLGLLTQSELTAIKNYEASHAKQTGVESSCVLGHKACGDSCACCLGTCGTLNGSPKCFGVC